MWGVGVLVLVCLSFLASVQAHSWVQCVDYTEENGRYWDAAKCRAWPRNYQEGFRYTQPPYLFGGDAGYDWKPGDNQGKPCKYARNPSSDYTATYPKATYSPGQRVCMAWPPKNHVAAACNNPDTPDSGTKIWRSNVNANTDPTLAEFHNNLVFDFGVNTGLNGKAFQNCPNFCAEPGAALCTGCFNIPNNLALGSYTFLWEWAFNSATDLYTNCFEVEIVANSGKGITSTLAHITPDAFKAALAATTTSSPSISPTPAPSGGGGSSPTPAASAPTPAASAPTPAASAPTPAPQTSGGGAPSGGTVIFNGNFNQYTTSTDFDTWSWANQGTWPYQTYIFGNANTANKMSTFVTLGSEYQNTRDSSATRGVKLQINENSKWNGQTMLRTELVVQPSRIPAAAFQGTKYFHFSLRQGSTNPLKADYEHQIMFFEAHFADIKFGGAFGNQLNFVTSNNVAAWTTPFTADVWHNFAIMVDFSGQKVGLYYSTGTNTLQQVVNPTTSSPSSSDWHVGLLRLPKDNAQGAGASDLQICSVYIADAVLTFTAGGGGAAGGGGGGGSSPTNAPTPAPANAPTPAPGAQTTTTTTKQVGGSTTTTASNANPNVPTDCDVGSEGCSCTAKGKTCDAGLVCASNVCIDPKTIPGYQQQLSAASTQVISTLLVVVAFIAMLM